jgi:hypothetical protein
LRGVSNHLAPSLLPSFETLASQAPQDEDREKKKPGRMGRV